MEQENYNEGYSLDGLHEAEATLLRIDQLLGQITT